MRWVIYGHNYRGVSVYRRSKYPLSVDMGVDNINKIWNDRQKKYSNMYSTIVRRNDRHRDTVRYLSESGR